MSHALLDRLAEAPLLVDGAMGTMLYAAHGGAPDACFDAEVLEALDLRRHDPAVLEEVRCVSS